MSDIQHQIADAVSRSFRKDLKTTRRALVRPPSRSVEAWRHYIRATQLSVSEPLKAVELYQAAVATDPNYALAWAGLALDLVKAADWGEARPTDVLPKAAEAARRALAADATFAESHVADAQVKVSYKHDWVGAGRAFRRALELDPTYHDASLYYAQFVLVPTGQFTQAVQELRRALALYPDSNLLLNGLASAYIKARQYGKAMESLEASQRISQTQLAAWIYLGMAEFGLGRHEEALSRFLTAASWRRTPWVISHLGYLYAKLGRTGEAQKTIAELEEAHDGGLAYDYEVATIQAALGNTEAAFAALDRAVANQTLELLAIKVDYRLDDLRADPRFGRLLRRMRLE